MKRKLIGLLILMLGLLPAGAQNKNDAKKVLDATAAAFKKQGGIEATFKAEQFDHSNLKGSVSGTMHIQGRQFQLTTPDMITWYNGETQWSYVKANEEVNVSVPTAEEQQNINPYAFLDIYKKGYNYSMKETTLRGKHCYEVTLKAQRKNNNLRTLIIDIEKSTYAPLCIRMQQNNQIWVRISVLSYTGNRHFKPEYFEFNHKDYPQAEIIDLR